MYKKLLIYIPLQIIMLSAWGQYKVTTSNVNFRSLPTNENNIISVIPKGTVVNVVDMGMLYGNWTVIYFREKVGFVINKSLADKSFPVTKIADILKKGKNQSNNNKYYGYDYNSWNSAMNSN